MAPPRPSAFAVPQRQAHARAYPLLNATSTAAAGEQSPHPRPPSTVHRHDQPAHPLHSHFPARPETGRGSANPYRNATHIGPRIYLLPTTQCIGCAIISTPSRRAASVSACHVRVSSGDNNDST